MKLNVNSEIYISDVRFNFEQVAWITDGKFHREAGPAVMYADGFQSWWVNGKRHREDGPAIIRDDGTKEWYVNGTRIK